MAIGVGVSLHANFFKMLTIKDSTTLIEGHSLEQSHTEDNYIIKLRVRTIRNLCVLPKCLLAITVFSAFGNYGLIN